MNRAEDKHIFYESDMYVRESSVAPQAVEKTFFDYHMYTLNHLTTLKDNQTKQINIINGSNIPYKQYYKLDLEEEKADSIVEFLNSKDGGLGIAMPKGKIKLYKADEADNSLEFIGEDLIDHTPKDEVIKLTIGKAFDITFDYNEMDRKKVSGFEHFKHEYVIKNHKEESAEIHFGHYAWGIWEMVTSSHAYTKKSSNTIEYVINVPADSEVKVEFEYKVDRRTEVVVKR